MMTTELDADGPSRDGVGKEISRHHRDSRWSCRHPKRVSHMSIGLHYTEGVDITSRITRRGNPGRSSVSSEWYEKHPPCRANEEDQGATKPGNSWHPPKKVMNSKHIGVEACAIQDITERSGNDTFRR